MANYWDFIEKFYSQKGLFTCSNKNTDNTYEVIVEHVMFPPIGKNELDIISDLFQKVLPPSYLKFLSITNGGLFYTQLRGSTNYGGFIIYPIDEIEEPHKEVIENLKEILEEEPDMFEDCTLTTNKCHQWLSNILIIGEEDQSGNFLAIDFNRNKGDSESPIIFLNHETPFSYADIEDDEPVLGNTIDELLYNAAQDPVDFLSKKLGATTFYLDEKDELWYPKKYQLLDVGSSSV